MSGRFDVEAVRAQFPALHQEIHGKPLVYLDSAASAQTPQAVIDAITQVYTRDYSNVHRGVHTLSQRATGAYEAARESCRKLLNAADTKEILFVRGATEGINLVAHTWGRANLGPGDEVLVTEMEHHSNFVPWQIVCEATGATLQVVGIDDDGALRLDELDAKLTERTKLVAAVHVSNALGTINPVEHIIELAHARGALVLLDGAQAVPHGPVDVQALGCDFYAFSGHKAYGPTGIGVLYGKRSVLEAMPPWQGGGDMIATVTLSGSTWAPLPAKFEAGTPNIAGAIGMGAAAEYLMDLDMAAVAAHEAELLAYGSQRLLEVPGLRLVGTANRKAGVLGFLLEYAHPHDIGTVLDMEGIAVRAGHHCAQPVMDHFGIPATVRASLGLYNTREDIDRLVAGLDRVREFFG